MLDTYVRAVYIYYKESNTGSHLGCIQLCFAQVVTSALISAKPSCVILQLFQLLIYTHFLIKIANTTRYVCVKTKGIVNIIKSADLISIKIDLYAYICLITRFSCSKKRYFVYIE